MAFEFALYMIFQGRWLWY